MELSFLAFLIAVGFLIKSLNILSYRLSVPYTLLCFFSLWIGLLFLPHSISPRMISLFGWFTLILALVFLVIEQVYYLLQWLGRSLSFKTGGSKKLPKELGEVLSALEQLASKRTGALIVIERKQPLDPFIRKAVTFDAEIKADVLISIFHTSSPLHDGALVISKGRIKAMRVILPLTEQLQIASGFGTRHRSALGMSEKTDAIILVSSEERGTMSIAFRGKLMQGVSREKLHELFHTALRGKDLSSE
ncbi:MAG: DNA integrity scanning protein DisA nucleotide-binding domain protein [Candidatus Omnitrophica bacterium]|nr:DNA integrity scanning protein DisA nucleotide-binding domain protein [Candidatus Omnitrophota bacterium]